MEKHFVTFYSPGTFVSETTTRDIPAWDVELAKEMASTVFERHGARPYGFEFTTRGRGPNDLDSKVIAKSGTYFLGGVIETYEQVVARNDPEERILRDNMRANGWDKIITNTNSWRITRPFEEGDFLLEFAFPSVQENADA